ncbi:unnamed protein product [Calypogeia fissa]
MYKVCWAVEICATADILAAMDDAIADGVEVMSLSLGVNAVDYKSDVVAIGALHVVEKGIIVSCVAGNNGLISGYGSAYNTAPWIFTVVARSENSVFNSVLEISSNNHHLVSLVRVPTPFSTNFKESK